jgi:hypothetical protein
VGTSTTGVNTVPVDECAVKKDCSACVDDHNCGFCRGLYQGTPWYICRSVATVSNSAGVSSVCTNAGGSIVETNGCDPHVAATPQSNTVATPVATASGDAGAVIGAINSGQVNENTINQDINTSPSGINGYIVVVTVITQAAPDSDGNAHFQTFVDVSGSVAPNDNDKKAICSAIGDSLATHLKVNRVQVQCGLTSKSKRRADFQYVADLVVYGDSEVAADVAALVVSPLLVIAANLVAFLF